MLTLPEAKAWNPACVNHVAAELRMLATWAEESHATMRSSRNAVISAWTDRVGAKATDVMERWVEDVCLYRERLSASAVKIDSLGTQLAEHKRELEQALAAAGADGCLVTSSGVVVSAPQPQASGQSGAPAHVSLADSAKLGYEKKIQSCLLRMEITNLAIAGEFREIGAASRGIAADGHTGIVEPPAVPHNMNSHQAASWWQRLSVAERAALLSFGLPLLYGIRGLPAKVEDKANRWRLREETEISHYMRKQAEERSDGYSTDDDKRYWGRLAAVCDSTNSEIEQWDARVPGTPAAQVPPGTPLYLIDFNPTANNGSGRIVMALGNPDTATHVTGYVEGVGSSARKPPLDHGAALLGEQDYAFGDPTDHAVVIYQPGTEPPSVFGAINQHAADYYAPELRHEMNGVYESHVATSGDHYSSTVIGHSYGTEVVSTAMSGGGGIHGIDNLVFTASPGVKPDSPSVFGVPPSHVYAMRADGDPIGLAQLGGHGGPFDTDFGYNVQRTVGDFMNPGQHELHDPWDFATQIPTQPGGHSSYVEDPRDLYELARVSQGWGP